MIFLKSRAHTNSKSRNIIKILSTCLIIFPILIWILVNPSNVKSAWFNDNYAYRKYISFTHNAALTDRRVSVTVDTATLITAGKMQSDCDDTRFTDAVGKVLKHQLTGTCNNAATTYDVLIPTVINGLNAIYIYYGNPLAISGSTDISSFTSLSPSGGAASLATEEKGPTPILYWSFNDGNGTTAQDSSPNNNDATLTNSPTWQTEDMCVVDKCLKFDGSNDRVGKTYSSDTELDPSTVSFTVSTWAKHASAISGTDTILSRADGLNGVGYKIYMNSSGNLCFGIDASAGSFPSDSACSTTTYNDSQWHFIQAVKNGTTDITLYVDGNQVAQDASITASSISGTSSPIYAGIDADTTSNPWDGFIDEVKIYNYAKTAAQLKADKASLGGADQTSASFGSVDPYKSLSHGLVAWWKMDENTGTTTSDSSGNSNTSSAFTGNTTWTTGLYGSGLTFDGTDDVARIVESSSTDLGALNTSYTVSTWFKTSTNYAVSAYIVAKDDATTAPILLYMSSAERMVFQIGDGTSTPKAQSTGTYNDGRWHHAIGVRDAVNKTLSLYIDGALAASASDTTTATLVNNSDISIGNGGVSYTEFDFNGQIDESRIYNRALTSAEASQLYNFAPRPIGYWKLDESTGTSTGNTGSGGGTGTLNSGPTWGSGKFGNAVTFDATDDDILVATGSTYDFANTLTISAWIYPTSYGESLGYGTIFAHSFDAGNAYEFLTVNDAGGARTAGLVFYDVDGGVGQEVNPGVGNIITLNTWQHVSVVIQNSLAYFYVNGVGINPAGSAITVATKGSGNTYIGSFDGDQDTFGGKIDEVRVYNYPRTQNQILEDMNAGHPMVGTPVTGPVAYWKLDDAVGTTAQDTTPNNNDLTLSSASWTLSGKFDGAWNGTGGAIRMSKTTDADLEFGATDDFAIALWYKSDAAANPAATEYLVSDGGPANTAGYAIYANTSGNICFGIDDDTTWGPDVASCSTTDIYDNTWHHILAIRNASGTDTTYLYVDGKLADSDTDTTTATLDSSPSFYVGDMDTDNAGSGEEFAGDIDELKIYRAAHTSAQVLIEYNQGKAAVMGAVSTASDGTTVSNGADRAYCIPGDTSTCSIPISHLKLDENTGTTANDISGGATTGTWGTQARYSTGKIGTGALFTGLSTDNSSFSDDSVIALPNDIYDSLSTYTISMWFKPSDTGDDWQNFWGVNETSGVSSGQTYEFAYERSTNRVHVWTSGCDGGTDILGYAALSDPQTGWHHFAYINSSAGNFMYLDGQRQTMTYTSGNSGIDCGIDDIDGGGTTHYDLGCWSDGSDCYIAEMYEGMIDDYRMYNYIRTPAQIAWEYNRGAPIAHYKMDECSGTTINDSSGNSITGTLTIGGSGTYTSAGTCSSGTSTQAWNGGTTGKYSSSGAFDGTDDYITTATNSKLQGGTNVTLSAWVKPTSLSSNHCPVGLFGSSSDKGYWFNIPSTGEPQFYISRDGSAQDSVTGVPGQIATGTWSHMLATYDGTTMKIYLNGKLLNSVTQAGTIHTVSTSNAFAIGRLGATSADYFNGQVDDVRVYNYVATPAQVKAIYNENSAVRFGPEAGSP